MFARSSRFFLSTAMFLGGVKKRSFLYTPTFLFHAIVDVPKSVDAIAAYKLSLVVAEVVGVAAEQTTGIVLLEHYAIPIHKYLKRIARVKLHGFSYLDGKNYSSKLINGANDSC